MKRKLTGLLLASLCAVLCYAALPADCPEPARRTAAVFVIAAMLWAFETLALFATSLLVVLLLIFLLEWPRLVSGASLAGHEIYFQPFSSSVIMLFLGGFALARMLSKYGVDRVLACRLTRFFGTRPFGVLSGFVLATAFLSCWLSNTATTALMLAIVAPVLSGLGPDERFKKALVLAVPFAANIGGIITPVGSPPNAIAIGLLAEQRLSVGFLAWVRMALPIAVPVLFLACAVLYRLFPPTDRALRVPPIRSAALTAKGRAVLAVAAAVVAAWLSAEWHHVPESVVALTALGVFAVMGAMEREDMAHLHWDVLILMWGGLALGKAMESSGLGAWIVQLPVFSLSGYWLAAMFLGLAMAVSVFISNTASANLLIPLAISIPHENRVLLAVVVALGCSFDMLLPVSTPPNAMAFSTKLIAARDMLKAGTLIVAGALIVIMALIPYIARSLAV